ncbi:hypothetical protein G6F40_017886 [Rhizopus arrhizus]|nr:hypothetical protein G6F40_017886 [Rhizopus arrhizus]
MMVGKRCLGPGQQRQRGIDAGDTAAVFDQVAGDGNARATTYIQYLRMWDGKPFQERGQPGALDQFCTPRCRKRCGIRLVQGDHVVSGRGGHVGTLAMWMEAS